MRNFKEEIINTLKLAGYTIKDIDYINTKNEWVPGKDSKYYTPSYEKCENIEEWINNMDFEYEEEYGRNYINGDLKIVMKDNTRYSREEYDGSEWFRHNKKPERE